MSFDLLKTRRALLVTLLVLLSACGGSDDTTSETAQDTGADAGMDAAGGDDTSADTQTADSASDDADAAPDVEPLRANAGPNVNAYAGDEVTLSGADSTGAATFSWDPGDGSGATAPSSDPTLSHTYSEPGRYRAVLTVENAMGQQRSDEALVTVVNPAVFEPAASSTVAASPDGGWVAVVAPEAGELTVAAVTEEGLGEPTHVPVCAEPRTVTWLDSDTLAAACQGDDRVALLQLDGMEVETLELPYGARPYGVLALDGALWVTLQGRGELARLDEGDAGWEVTARVPVTRDARGVTLLPDGRLAVTRWRSSATHGEIAVVEPTSGEVTRWQLPFVEVPSDSDTETGGVPTWLDTLAVAPDGELLVVPALLANVGVGTALTGEDLTHETTVRAVVFWLDPTTGEVVRSLKQFDDRGFAAAAAFNPWGDYVWVAARGSRAVERLDRFTGGQSGSILNAGFAPSGVATSRDGRWLFVDAHLSRELRQYDVASSSLPTLLASVSTVSSEPWSAEVLLGAQLFNDAFDTRLALDSYIACAHCHLEGASDQLVWDFTGRGEGLRNTIDLRGRAGSGHGPLHWSANFDEPQDFEHDIRGPFGGLGLMTDEDFMSEGRDHPLGTPKAGVSADLDALAAYMTSLADYPRSPWRTDAGELTEAAQRGVALFEQLDCGSCHSGEAMTNSAIVDGEPTLHDVGTLTEASGSRLGGPLPGIDTPTLRGLWDNAPYLHDGSAVTLEEVLTTAAPESVHDTREALSDDERADLIAWLFSLDGSPR